MVQEFSNNNNYNRYYNRCSLCFIDFNMIEEGGSIAELPSLLQYFDVE
jgi:hypothetical protein